MCAINLPTRVFFFVGLLLRFPIAVSSFSTASLHPTTHCRPAGPERADAKTPSRTGAGSVVAAGTARREKRGRDSSLRSSEQNGGSSSVRSTTPFFGRRGFVSSCVVAAAAAACCAAASASPSNSITTPIDDDDDADDDGDATVLGANGVVDSVGSDDPRRLPASSSIGEVVRGGPTTTAFQESVSGFVSGSAVSLVKTLVKYPLDTVTVRLQMPNARYGWSDPTSLFGGSFDGIAAPLVSNLPSAGVFFAIKDATRSAMAGSALLGGLPRWTITSLAVGAAQPFYWMLRNPGEVIKTRMQVGAEGYRGGASAADALRLAVSRGGGGRGGGGDPAGGATHGLAGLYLGYWENILYAYPADIIKFCAYEYLTGLGGGKEGARKDAAVSPADGAVYGALSTAMSQFATTPLDVVRNRIMAEVAPSAAAGGDVAGPSYVDRLAGIAREEGLGALFAGSWPRVAKALLSGAVQFATYEETKQKMGELFIKR
jgi:hypothetical protein